MNDNASDTNIDMILKGSSTILPHRVRSTSQNLLAGSAAPNADNRPLDCVLAAERASVGGVLRHLHLLDLLSQRCTITGTVLAGYTCFLRSLTL